MATAGGNHIGCLAALVLGVSLLCITLVIGLAPPVGASVMPLTVEEMAKLSDRIVLVRTVETESHWTGADAARGPAYQIETTVRLEVLNAIKGTAGSDLTLVLPGGKVGDLTLSLDSVPAFLPGETSILFLDSKDRIIGGPQGNLTVVNGWVPRLERPLSEVVSHLRAQARGGLSSEPGGHLVLPSGHPLDWRTSGVPCVTSSDDGSSAQGTATVLLSDDFEQGLVNWPWLVGDPTWGTTRYRANGGVNSAYCVGSSIDAPGPYPPLTQAWMIAGPFDLTAATTGTLEFDQYLATEQDFDVLYAAFSVDGVNFYGPAWSGSSDGAWLHETVNLLDVVDDVGHPVDLLGQPQVWVAFVFFSDDSINDEGAYVDNVVLAVSTDPLPPPPVIGGIDPPAASAGTDTPVTISGSNFGTVPGRVQFGFPGWMGGLPAPIVSWSDTTITCLVPMYSSSGIVRVVTSARQSSNEYGFEVTFGYLGMKWDVAKVKYQVNPNTADTNHELSAILAAARTWNRYSPFRLVYAGRTDAANLSFEPPNEIMWVSDMPDFVLAYAWTMWSATEGIVWTGITFNDSFEWGDGTAGTIDIESVALHEFGHWLALSDLYGAADSEKAMLGAYTGEQKRMLDPDDIAGIQWIYGEPRGPVPLPPQ